MLSFETCDIISMIFSNAPHKQPPPV